MEARQLTPRRLAAALLLLLAPRASSKVPRPSSVRNCCAAHTYRIGLPPEQISPLVAFDTQKQQHSGMVIDVIDQLRLEMRADIQIVPTTATLLPGALQAGTVNMIGVITSDYAPIPPEGVSAFEYHKLHGPQYDEFTPELFSSPYRVLLKRTTREVTRFAFLDPFSTELWLMVLFSIVCSAVVMAAIEVTYPYQDNTRVSMSAARFAKLCYHSVSLIQQQDDFEWITPPMRLLRISMMFVGIILTGSYTANLAAFFSTPQSTINGPQSLEELRDAKVCTILAEDWVDQWTDAVYLGSADRLACRCPTSNYEQLEPCSRLHDPASDCQLDEDVQLSHCHELLRKGEVEAIVALEPVLNVFLRDKCAELAFAEYRFGSVNFGLRVPKAFGEWGAVARHNLSVAIANLMQLPVYQGIQQDHFGDVSCRVKEEETDEATLTLRQMSGLFLVFGVCAGVSFLLAVGGRVHRHFTHSCARDEERTSTEPTERDELAMMTDAEILRKLYSAVKAEGALELTRATSRSDVRRIGRAHESEHRDAGEVQAHVVKH
ncbi:hypothetical protein AB1Y20_014009 [Prymnesium parvum]|uniref:Ionotropic glutamate receptor C-terminal domain-containing protein n=1 Tax=Prymnesium parvum TaxID=97485 RepID=A0AB34IG55_PRYPA